MEKFALFEKTIYRKRLEKSFYHYCLLRQISLIRFLPGFILLGFLRFFGAVNREKYLAKRWSFLGSVKKLGERLERFAEREKNVIYIPDEGLTAVSEHPEAAVSEFGKRYGFEIKANKYDAEKCSFADFRTARDIVKDKKYTAYGEIFSPLMNGAEKKIYIYRRRVYKHKGSAMAVNFCHCFFTYAAMVAWSVCLGFASLYWAAQAFTFDSPEVLFDAYLTNPLTVWLNLLPVIFLTLILYFASNSSWFAIFLSSVLTMVCTWVNHFKLMFRDDPFLFEDLTIVMEAKQMTESYKIVLEPGMWIFMAAIAVIMVLFGYFGRCKTRPLHLRLGILVVLIVTSMVGINKYYLSETIYNQTANNSVINQWSTTQQFQVRGFVYPFINSLKTAFETVPEGYNEKETAAMLGEYESEDIPEDKRVNIISVMLEAYGDFTRFDELEFTNDPNQYLKDIAAESYSGTLINNIFAAGTVDTERCFLTGLVDLPTFRRNTNSHVWYFADQGYLTEGGHPSNNWFYNRRNINRYLGFQNYYFDEDTYMELNDGKRTANNDVLFDHILEQFESVTSSGEDYFSFSVTYEGHGPYSDEPFFWHEYMANQGYSDYAYNTINNYFSLIEHVGYTASLMIDELRQSEEPVVVIMFGDHMPWMGNSNSIYEELGINLDVSTDEGFTNYYETPYFIWANDAAKEVLGNDFTGEGPTISPCFLMAEFFELAGWEGSEYMQYLSDLSDKLPVIHNTGIVMLPDGTVVRDLSEEYQALVDEFTSAQYYWRNNIK